MKEECPAFPGGMVDLEVDCATCATRLYVPEASIDAVLASLERTGMAILICAACRQAQLVRWKVSRGRGLQA